MSNAEQDINAFCSALLGGPDGTGDDRLIGYHLCVWTLPDRVARWIPAEAPGSIASVVLELANRQPSAVHAVYIGMGFVPNAVVDRKVREEKQDGKNRRAEARDIAGIPGLWADIDIAGHGHAKDGLPPDVDAALAIVDSLGVEPTLIIHTGRGIQVWWAFTEPAIFEDDAERADIADLAKSWNMTIKVRAGQWAAGVDSVFDLPRLMRAVGSTNTKGSDGKHGGPPEGHRQVTIIRNTGFTWNPEDFREFLAGPDAIAAVSAVTPVSGHDAASLDGVDLHAVWRRASSIPSRERGYVPTFVAQMIDVDDTTKLAATWYRRRPEFKDDQSTYDAALTRLLHDAGAPVADQVEALMCHRLAAGGDTDKVNPAKRTDYIARTVLNVHAMAEKAATDRAEAKAERDVVVNGIAEHADKPVELAVVPDAPEPDPIVDTTPDILVVETAPPVGLTLVREPAPRDTPADTEPDEPEVWGARHPDTVSILGLLDKLLIPEKYRSAGIRTWGMEHRDYGENQKGRLIFEIPDGYGWPGGGPSLYTPGNPLKAEWYPKPMFEGPKGFRASLERDAMIPSLPVGKNKEEWAAIATELVGHWQQDSTGADLATTVKDWLLEYLTSHPATTIDGGINGAVDVKRAYMKDTRDWGALGTPCVLFPLPAFIQYVAVQPGGKAHGGRAGKDLTNYLRVRDARPYLNGPDGKLRRRANWWEIDATQFTMDEWGQVIESAHEFMVSSEERRFRSIDGGLA